MRYRLTFTVNDKSEDAAFINSRYKNNENIMIGNIAKWGCNIAKILNQNQDHSIYSFYDAEILED